MGKESSFADVFASLKDILKKYAGDLNCVRDIPGDYYLDTRHKMRNKKPLFFGAVQIKKNYVSYHLMPIYVFPELLQKLTPGLKRRMQGKSCFNFKSPDIELFKEIASLTNAGFMRYKEAGYV